MCGICAIYGPAAADLEPIGAMTDCLRHRGPDHGQTLLAPPVALGHRRLSIIDLSPSANQPMANEDGQVQLVCNGEIYNFQEIRQGLLARGHQLRSHSDCEVLVHLYEERGLDFLEGVNGMFALVLWDQPRGRLLAAVDRFGKKPLYFAQDGGRLALASEMKSLLLLPWVGRDLDPVALDRYLSLRYVPAPLTILRGVRKLAQAEMLVWEGQRLSRRTYWQPQPSAPQPYGPQAARRFDELMSDAVGLRLQSDVPLGLYLSGGVDSCLIGALMRGGLEAQRISYTIGFDYAYNEQPRAAQVARELGFKFNPVSVGQDDFALSPTIAYHLDEPFGDLLAFPAYLLAREAKRQLTVVLTGDGADETLLGYLHQKVMLWRQRAGALTGLPGLGPGLAAILRLAPARLLDAWFDYPDRLGPREKGKLCQAVEAMGSFGAFYEAFTSCFTAGDKARLYLPGAGGAGGAEPLSAHYDRDMAAWGDFAFPSRLSLLDLKYWIPFSVLYRLDKLNMAHAVETRSPFLDYRVVEFALGLELVGKLDGRRNKRALRDLLDRHLPQHLRPQGKQAFYMPLTGGLRQAFEGWTRSLLDRQSLGRRGLFAWPYVEELFALSGRGSMLANRQLTALAMLEQWMRVFMDRQNCWETPQVD